MVILILLLIAAGIVTVCLCRTEKTLKTRRQMVTEAATQLHQAQHRTEKKPNSHKSDEVLARSRRIYAQSVTLYEQTLAQQKYRLWASVLGYGPIGEDGKPIYTAPLWRREKQSQEQKGAPVMKTNNMKRAVFEMFGVGKDSSSEAIIIKTKNLEDNKNSTEAMVARPVDTLSSVSAEPAAPVAAPVVSLRPVSYLAADTAWEGNLRSDGDVEVAGVFRGDIHAKGSVILHSTVEGNVFAGTLQLTGCSLTGDAVTGELTVISADSQIRGCVTAHDLRCSGTIIGDIAVTGHITLEHTAHISGNIITGSISVAKGAVICGGVEIKTGES